ncbi:hypothetical protein ACX1N5_15755, partial [Acinetobacter sp. ANC 4636]
KSHYEHVYCTAEFNSRISSSSMINFYIWCIKDKCDELWVKYSGFVIPYCCFYSEMIISC